MEQVGFSGATWVSVADAAEFLEVSTSAVWQAIRRGRIVSEERGGVRFVAVESVLEYRRTRRIPLGCERYVYAADALRRVAQ